MFADVGVRVIFAFVVIVELVEEELFVVADTELLAVAAAVLRLIVK